MPTCLLDIAARSRKTLLAVCACAFFFLTSFLAHTQSGFTWNTGNGTWSDNSSWTLSGNSSGYPDAAGDLVYFSQNSTTIDIAMPSDSTAVAGAITMNGSGTVRLGNSTTFSGSLRLEADPGQTPLFEVNGTRLAIFTELTGTQGFRKTGNGTLGFQTNPLDMVNLSGNVSIEQGTVWFHKAGSFGTGHINLSGNGTILEMRSNAGATSTTFNANQTLSIALGSNVILRHQTGSNQTMVFEGDVAGGGDVTFQNGNFMLNGATDLTGNVTVFAGSNNNAQVISGPQTNISSSIFSFGQALQTNSTASFEIQGGTIATTTIQSLTTANSTLILGGNTTFTNISGSNFNITGNSSAASGLMGISVNQSATFSANNANIHFSSNSSLKGSGNLSKTGSGDLILDSTSRNHTFNGTLAVFSGNLILNSNLASATVRIDGGSMGGNSTISNLILNQNLSIQSGDTFTIGSSLSGNSNLSKSGAGNLTIGNAASFAGNLSLSSSAYLQMNSGTDAPIFLASSTLDGNGTIGSLTVSEYSVLNIGPSRTLNIGGGLAGSGSLTKNGSGDLVLSNTSSFSGNLSINSGNVILNSSSLNDVALNASTLAGSGTIQNLSISGASILNIGSDGTLNVNSSIVGTSGFTKNGTGTLSLAAGTTSGLAGAITVNAGRLETLSNIAPNITLGTATLSGNASLGNLSIATGASATLEAGTDQTLSVSTGALTGRGNFTKTGAGTLTIGGSAGHTFNGTSTITAGSLLLGANMTSSTVRLDGGTISTSGSRSIGNLALDQNSTLNLPDSLTVNASLTGSGQLTKSGAGNLTISNATNYSGSFQVSGGGLFINSNSTAPVSLSSSTLGGNGVLQSVSSTGASTFDIAASRSLTINASLTGSGSFVKTGSGNLTINDATGYSGTANATAGGILFNGNFGQTLALSGATLGGGSTIHSLTIQGNSTVNTTQNITISNTISGSSRITKNGTGALIFASGSNTASFTGPITLNSGILQTASNLSSNITVAGGTIAGDAILSGTISVTANGSVFDVSTGGTLSINGSAARLSGNRNFTKTGAGTLAVQTAASHTYSGTATIAAGTMVVSSGANLTSSSITVDGSAAILGGAGRFNILTLANGTIAPSAGAAAGALTTLNAASLAWNGGTISMRLGDSGNLTSSDRIVLSGALTRGSGPDFIFDFNGTGAEGGNYTLMTFASSTFSSSNFTISNLAPGPGSSLTVNPTSLVLNVVPEPGTWALLLAAAVLLTATSGKARLRLGSLVCNGTKFRRSAATKHRGGPAG